MWGIKAGKIGMVVALALLSLFLFLTVLPSGCFASDVAVTMFGPKQYLRTTNSVDVFTDYFSGVPGNGTLIIQNGDGKGHNRVDDLLILINGSPLLDWSALMQPGYKLAEPISMLDNNSLLVIILGKPGSYLTIQAQAEITPDATTTQVVGIKGGTLSVENHLGDIFTLTIPPLVLGVDTSISVSALPNALPSPIAANAYPGVVLEPEGLLFDVPVKMEVALHGTSPNSNPAILFWYLDSSDLLAIGNQAATQNSVSGQNYHSSTYTAGFPTPGELSTIITTILTNAAAEGATDADTAQAVAQIAFYAQQLEAIDPAFEAIADWALTTATTLATNAAEQELNTKIPGDPCEQKLEVHNLQLAAVLQSLGLDDLASAILSRDCHLSIIPGDELFLFEGQAARVTATLLDPHGNTTPCAPINWEDGDESVAAIAPRGNACTITGVGPGLTSVGASCKGFPAAIPVSVCSMTGTYSGTYSGETTTHDGKPKYISGSISIPFTQDGTSISAVIMGYNVTGTNIDGGVSLVAHGTPHPAGASGRLSSDCSIFSGSFDVARKRRISGTFTLTRTSP